MEQYIISNTSAWGWSRGFNPRMMQKLKVLQCYPFVDHYKTFALKPPNQRGPARQSQMFIVSYAYVYDEYIGTKETEFITMLESTGLRFHKEPCTFRGKNAYRIFVIDEDVELDSIINYDFNIL